MIQTWLTYISKSGDVALRCAARDRYYKKTYFCFLVHKANHELKRSVLFFPFSSSCRKHMQYEDT
jgi:hypothetical protein